MRHILPCYDPAHARASRSRTASASQQTPAPPYLRPRLRGPLLRQSSNLPISSPDRRHLGRSRKSDAAPVMPSLSSRMGTVSATSHLKLSPSQGLAPNLVYKRASFLLGVHIMQQPQLDVVRCHFCSPPHSLLDDESGGKDLRQESLLDLI